MPLRSMRVIGRDGARESVNIPAHTVHSRALTGAVGARAAVARMPIAFAAIVVMCLGLVATQPVLGQTLGNCQTDVQGANDQPGQKDLTQFCAELGDFFPFDLHTLWNWDLVSLPGGNTGDACTLYDTDADGNANIAVCVTIGGNPASLKAVRLFTCGDTRPDRCTGSSQLAVNRCGGSGAVCSSGSDCTSPDARIPDPTVANTNCMVTQENTDPFVSGDAFPADTEALCWVDLDDFGVTPGSTLLIDACSYPSESVNSDPSDCINFQACASDGECDDGNSCTVDTCDTVVGACQHTPDTGSPCDDGDACTANNTCTSLGFCDGGSALNCDDNNSCTDDSCDSATGCVNLNNTSPCDDGNACTTVDTCGSGTCNGGASPDCDDGNPCTDDSCAPATGCVNTNNTAPCSDGNGCTTGDTCSGGSCASGSPVVCSDDGVFCNGTESCDPAIGQCVSSGTPCSGTNGVCCEIAGACQSGPCGAIPTVSQWGLLILTLLLLAGAKAYFGRRQELG